MVVAFHFEDLGLAVADVYDSRIFAGTADDLRAFGWQGAQPLLGRLVRAVLVPHRREDAKLGKVWLAVQDANDLFVFFGLEAVGLDQFGRDRRILHVGSPQVLVGP